MTPCRIVEGVVPDELAGGQYVRNGGNPLKGDDDQRDAHWFDGDGMLTGVFFQRDTGKADEGAPRPHFINRYILTDVLLSTGPSLRRPLIPSIATFAAAFSPWSLLVIVAQILRAAILTLLSWLPFQSPIALKRISVANTSVWWHDGRAFAGCESGPPIRILLPGLETADWWAGTDADEAGASSKAHNNGWVCGLGPFAMLSEFTTAHPRIDPETNELLLYHMSFVSPYLRISVIPPRSGPAAQLPALKGVAVPGLSRPKLAHDFCATSKHTIHIDLPLTLDPLNLARRKGMLHFEADMPTRFGVFPRRQPEKVRWYESETCCIYHAANAWDTIDVADSIDNVTGHTVRETTNLVACRLNSATLVYAAGNLETPAHAQPKSGVEKCQLYYWQFAADPHLSGARPSKAEAQRPMCEFPLSDIPVEFPMMNSNYSQRKSRFVYAASMSSGSFDAGLGSRSAKIDCLAKFDIERLIAQGKQRIADGTLTHGQAVDVRTVSKVLADQCQSPKETSPAISLFALPLHHYAQEATFVPRSNAQSEDDGYLIFFVFDESRGLDSSTAQCTPDARSELWIIDALNMRDIICRIELPQRVPYGLHGHFFAEEEIQAQRPVHNATVRNWALAKSSAVPPRSGTVGMDGVKASMPGGSHPNLISGALTLLFSSARSTIERLLA